ncbi:MAG: histidine--tRNA ligase, partial [Glaciihabitans sp.]|nr:histidine--tRNA ligase [Glaciihabitans sp.]
QLIAEGYRVRLVRRAKNVKVLFEGLAADGFTHFAFVNAQTTSADDLERKSLSV